MPLQADLTAACQNGIAGEFGAIIADDHTKLFEASDRREPGGQITSKISGAVYTA